MVPLVLSGLAPTACPQVGAVWIDPVSTADHLVLQLGRRRGQPDSVGVSAVIVVDCAHTTGPIPDSVSAWSIRHPLTVSLSQITYGQPPAGFETRHPQLALLPGCYVAEVGGIGNVKFLVAQNGAVTDQGRGY